VMWNLLFIVDPRVATILPVLGGKLPYSIALKGVGRAKSFEQGSPKKLCKVSQFNEKG
jgi:hypothetical protein